MGKTNWKMVAGGVAIFVLGIAAAWVGPMNAFIPETTLAQPALYDEGTVTSIFEKSTPAIVEIDTTQTTMRGRVAQGQGTGFLVKNDGTILTNNHVVEGASKVTVVFSNGKTVSANVIGTDALHDLAVIRVVPSAVTGVTPLTLGDSGTLKPGQMAIAIGFPFGLDESITVGVISGLNRRVGSSQLNGMIQTDAALNPGNSGGPLLNANGEVIGINTATEAQPGANGIGFAVPSNVVKNVLPTLSAGKPVQRVYMGITGQALNANIAQQLGLSIEQGIYIINVAAGSPADKAGLKGSGASTNGTLTAGGDIINAVDGRTVKTVNDLTAELFSKQVGDQIRLGVIRGGNSINITLTLGAWPSVN